MPKKKEKFRPSWSQAFFLLLIIFLLIKGTYSHSRIWKLVCVEISDFQKSQSFSKVLNGTKLYARVHFDRRHIIFMKLWYKNNNTRKASQTLLSRQSLLLKQIETHLKYVLSFSAMDETPAFVTGHMISPKNPIQRILCQFVNKTQFFTSEKCIGLIVIFFFSYNYQFMDVYRTATKHFLKNRNSSVNEPF